MKNSLDDKIKINGIDLKEIYKVPDGYFEDFPTRIQERISQTVKPSGIRKLILYPQFKVVAAAVLVILLFVTIVERNVLFSGKNVENIGELIENYSYDIDESLILTYMEEEMDLYNSEDELSEEMIEYLLDEGIAVESILEAFE